MKMVMLVSDGFEKKRFQKCYNTNGFNIYIEFNVRNFIVFSRVFVFV